MNSSIFSFEIFRRYWRLPRRERVWHCAITVAFACVLAAGWLAKSTVRPQQAMTNIHRAAYESLSHKTQILAVGSSRVYHGIDPREFRVLATNSTMGGANFQIQEVLLRHALDRAPNVRFVLLEFGYVPLESYGKYDYRGDYAGLLDQGVQLDDLGLSWREYFKAYVDHPPLFRYRFTPEVWIVHRRPVIPGFSPSERIMPSDEAIACNDRIATETRNSAHCPLSPSELISLNRLALLRIVSLLRARGIPFALVDFPMHPLVPRIREYSHSPAYLETLQMLQANAGGVEHWDLSLCEFLSEKEFSDEDHLNKHGARKLTQYLDRRIHGDGGRDVAGLETDSDGSM